MKQQNKKTLTLKTLSKGNVWDLQENDVFRLMESGEKDADMKDNMSHYTDIIRSAFTIERLDSDVPNVKKKYEKLGYKVGNIKLDEDTKIFWAIKKRPIMRVTDLTYENIRHISASKLVEVLDRNFGGGWESLSQSIQDIIESGFDISTTTLPKDRLHKAGGMYEKKVADGFEVLEIPKGSWMEAIFAKEKPIMEKPHMKFDDAEDEKVEDDEDDNEDDEENITEENYRTTSFDEEKDPDDEEGESQTEDSFEEE
jgi:hypothetical protein